MRFYGGSLNSNLMRAEQIIIPCDKVSAARADDFVASAIDAIVATSKARRLDG